MAGASGAGLFGALPVTGGTVTAVPLDHCGATLLRVAGCGPLVLGTALVARG